MEALAENMSTFVLGVVVPLSTMAAVAIGCGDSRQAAKNRKKPGQVSKHGSVSSKKNHSSKSKSGRVISSNKSLKKSKHGSESKKVEKNAAIKDASKKPSKTKTIPCGKATKPGSIKSVSATTSGKSASVSGKSASAEVTAKLPSFKPPQSYRPLESSRRSVPVYSAEPSSHVRMEPHQLFYNSFGGVQQVTLHNTGANTERHAIKVKCSDNGMYRVNPVHAFVEPGQSLSLNVYRNASAVSSESRLDKLVFVVAPVSKEEIDPMNAFKDERVNHPKLVLPLVVTCASAASAIPGFNEASGLCV